jgi:hypothetical protein
MSHYYENPLSIFNLPPGSNIETEVDAIFASIAAAGMTDEYAGLLAELGASGLARVIAASDSRFPPPKDSPVIALFRIASSLPEFPFAPGTKINLPALVKSILENLSLHRNQLIAAWRALILFAKETGMKLTSEGWLMMLEERLLSGVWWNRVWGEVGKWDRKTWNSFLAKLEGLGGRIGGKAGELKEKLARFHRNEEFKPRLPGQTVNELRRGTLHSRKVREDETKRAIEGQGDTIDDWRAEACGWFEVEIRQGLRSPHLVPFAEIWCFDNAATLEKVGSSC